MYPDVDNHSHRIANHTRENASMSTVRYTFTDSNGYDDTEMSVPGKYDVCPRCEGTGKHDHPAFSNGITAAEWNSPDWDEDSRESYVRGDYDVPCGECDGARVVCVPDLARCSSDERAAIKRHAELEREMRNDHESERWLRYAETGVMG